MLAGRALFGVEIGWGFLFILFFTVLAYRQRRRPLRLSIGQAWSQIAVWAALALGGAAVIDYVDAAMAGVTWLVLTVLLVLGLRVKDEGAQPV